VINEDIYKRIEGIGEDSIEDVFYALVEEVGELSLCLHVDRGTKHRELKESASHEAVDVLLCGIEMLVKLGTSAEKINEIAKAKLDKWEKSVTERRVKTTSSMKELGRVKIGNQFFDCDGVKIYRNGKQDGWLVSDGYIKSDYINFSNFNALHGEIIIYSNTPAPKGPDYWLVSEGYL
jgi:hypothetical protein